MTYPSASIIPDGTPKRRRFRSFKWLFGGTVVLFVAALFLVPAIFHMDPVTPTGARLLNPGPQHLLGTDQYGRDILARIVVGARWSLGGALAISAGTALLGFFVGALAAFSPRIVDTIISRIVDAWLALPAIVIALAVAALLGRSFNNVVLAIIFAHWPWHARIYRSLIRAEKTQTYVTAARLLGVHPAMVAIQHILPNIIGPAIVVATAAFGSHILSLASLSFLGLGPQPPLPEWGLMISEARSFFQLKPWLMAVPGLAIVIAVLAVNMIGDALRDMLDPAGRAATVA
ncbi:ABC transporter permease [Rhizobium laguerreae]|uniref:ABC transporter permease n=1 Tax=Rhizobium laguerreae TaxID=1076926 RepID=UPI001C9254D2|nr:ABC transporter permease [Rhizobium laguerreae]MBY3088425.1 ABC transporter permease [Rhizobium laguerreae]MBY3149405.1 ABC transporter permease [Rhizobium laguerreae]